jgi:hypothetical protein
MGLKGDIPRNLPIASLPSLFLVEYRDVSFQDILGFVLIQNRFAQEDVPRCDVPSC